MLAQNFKTAADMGISEIEVDALIKALGMLEREELVHVAPYDVSNPNGFNMSPVLRRSECGTVGCIAGWVEVICGHSLSEMRMDSEQKSAWGRLIMPSGGRWKDITPAEAAVALRSYLTTGEANWSEALASR